MNTNVFNSFRARILAGGAALLAVLVLGLALSLSGGLVRAQDSTIEYAENGKDPVTTFTCRWTPRTIRSLGRVVDCGGTAPLCPQTSLIGHR